MRLLALIPLVLVLVPLVPAADEPKPLDDFPRRAFLIQVNNYLYLNPLTTSTPEKNREAIDHFAATLHIPTWKTNNQLFILSDNLLPPAERLPTKGMILAGIRHFCETSRSQDRILLYLRGHAFDKNEKGYFAPIEGEATDFSTLIPVDDIYAILKSCKATQRVIVWDVCPRNPDQAPLRPRSGPMTLELFLALLNPPTGVQAIVPCIPAEYSLEYRSPKGDPGSALFDALRKGFEETTKKAVHADPIPVIEAFPTIEKHVESAAKAFGSRQTAKLMGNLPAKLAALDTREPLPAAVSFPVLRFQAAAEVKSILHDLSLPPLFTDEVNDHIPPLPLDANALKPYVADVSIDDIFRDSEKYPLRVAVLRASQTIRDTTHVRGPKDAKPIVVVNSPVSDIFKRTVNDAQAPLAVALAKLEDELTALEAVGKMKSKETKRWLANYEYILGQVRLRLALLNEYNLILGHVRTESLPELPSGSTGWRLTHTEKMSSKKNVQELAEAARASFEAVVSANKGTPWEVIAKRALLTPPGLKWEPIVK